MYLHPKLSEESLIISYVFKSEGKNKSLNGGKDKLQEEEEEEEIDRKKRQKTKQKLSSISHRSPLPEASVT